MNERQPLLGYRRATDIPAQAFELLAFIGPGRQPGAAAVPAAGDAIAEANRYSRDQVVLDATRLQNARISGVFEAGRNDLFVEGLQALFDLHVDRTDDGRFLLTDAPLASR